MLITLVLIVVANAQLCAYGREIVDISHAYRDDMPVGESAEGLGNPLKLVASMKNGSDYNFSEMKMIVHTGTHVDSPAHFYQEYYEAGLDVDTLDLYILNEEEDEEMLVCDLQPISNYEEYKNQSACSPKEDMFKSSLQPYEDKDRGDSLIKGTNEEHMKIEENTAMEMVKPAILDQLHEGPALVVDVPRNTNITAKVMKDLNIPRGIQRVLFRTLNTDRRLMWKREFDSSFVGFMEDGAQWLVDNTSIKLVGIDYLSAGAYVQATSAHLVFLKSKDIILVEGLKLDDVELGIYSLHCLPLRLLGAEGSPARCILIR